MKQATIGKEFRMTGMGLHTGRTVTVTVRPAPPDFGIAFRRTDRFNIVTQRAQASNVSETKRGTTLGGGRHGVWQGQSVPERGGGHIFTSEDLVAEPFAHVTLLKAICCQNLNQLDWAFSIQVMSKQIGREEPPNQGKGLRFALTGRLFGNGLAYCLKIRIVDKRREND